MRFSWRVAIPVTFLFLSVAFSLYLWTLYRQLTLAFAQQEQFVPTRIYSDVTRIAAPQPRAPIEERLQALGYSPTSGADSLTFNLHPIAYPKYLIPEGHPVLEAENKPITLTFAGSGKAAVLQSVKINGAEAAEAFVEPEIVAILSRGSKNEIRDLVKFEDIPAHVWQAIIAIEDQHFLEHNGLDPRGLARAIWVDLRTHSFAQGGSTITLQLVKNLMARRGKNIIRKINELFLALLLEAKYDKEKILERYLNEVYLGQVGSLEVHGVSEGAQLFFGKRLDELNLAEITLMAGLIRGPGFYSPYRYKDRAFQRQRLVLRKMVETGQIAEAEAKAAAQMPIRLAPPRAGVNKAPYFSDFVKAELIRQLKDRLTEEELPSAGFRVYTTLDMTMNTAAQRAVTRGIDDLEKRMKLSGKDRLEGALAAVDHTTGFIKALVGGRNYSESTFNRILNMRRQVGSTFKPVVYLAAFEKGEDPQGIPYGPAHPVEDAPWKLVYDHGRQTWAPRNYEKEFLGWINYRKALAHSINTVAARLGMEIGIDSIIVTGKALGIESDLPHVPSVSLGVAELSPVDLLRAYATIANHGIQDELTAIRGITHDDGTSFARFVYHPNEVFPAGPTDLLTDTLTSVFTEGTAKAASTMGFTRPAAGKTGTTSHHRDSWFAGYTPQLTSVVWVGMDQPPLESEKGRTKVNLTGASSALPIWVDFMKAALAGFVVENFPESPNLIEIKVDMHSGKAARYGCPDSQVVTDKYIRGHEPKSEACEANWPPTSSELIE